MTEDAVRIAYLISDRDIRNGGVALQNAIVRWDSNTSKYKAMMTDFGQCVFRNATHEWRRQQQAQDEKGAMERYMQGRLEKIGRKGYYVYTRSEKYVKLDEEFQDGEDNE